MPHKKAFVQSLRTKALLAIIRGDTNRLSNAAIVSISCYLNYACTTDFNLFKKTKSVFEHNHQSLLANSPGILCTPLEQLHQHCMSSIHMNLVNGNN